jgi:hypothetical protein
MNIIISILCIIIGMAVALLTVPKLLKKRSEELCTAQQELMGKYVSRTPLLCPICKQEAKYEAPTFPDDRHVFWCGNKENTHYVEIGAANKIDAAKE